MLLAHYFYQIILTIQFNVEFEASYQTSLQRLAIVDASNHKMDNAYILIRDNLSKKAEKLGEWVSKESFKPQKKSMLAQPDPKELAKEKNLPKFLELAKRLGVFYCVLSNALSDPRGWHLADMQQRMGREVQSGLKFFADTLRSLKLDVNEVKDRIANAELLLKEREKQFSTKSRLIDAREKIQDVERFIPMLQAGLKEINTYF